MGLVSCCLCRMENIGRKFLSDATPLSNLKLRVGFGITGNQDIPLYASIAKYNDLGYAYYNGKWDKVYGPVSNPNPDLKMGEER